MGDKFNQNGPQNLVPSRVSSARVFSLWSYRQIDGLGGGVLMITALIT